MKKEIRPVWNVIYHNINGDRIDAYNVFEHGGLYKDVLKAAKECTTKEEFADTIRLTVGYYFRARAEWEIGVIPWVGGKNVPPKQYDVYEQVRLNWDAFVDYTWKAMGKV